MKNIERDKLDEILKDRELKYLSILILKKYNCLDLEKIKEDFKINTKRTLKYNENKAQEKLLVNYNFREKYFHMDEEVKKTE
ncbi:ribose-5-phosphate isomerase [Oceanirhabdus sp. W0125-5]|uniref:ribose-5-phosphate isomerase n=1 Tax=Oceanirhabdus sp. W0125-5 TaxID=2999116 RepID=UPI0022F2F470|nr:ribose-5-phosphate isomerase [Oceanirhabdus sp. W0125-5]WBW98471.1 ribose-5-phosphate isomerase [Oceanirhabdus sp. W0125-5]